MSIFYETLEKFKDFTTKINITVEQSRPKASLYENILNAYESVLDGQANLENKKFLDFREKLSDLRKGMDDKGKILKELELLVINFQDAYKKKKKEIELVTISQKAFVRIKEEEVLNYLAMHAQRSKEKQVIESKKEKIDQEKVDLKKEIDAKCLEYINKVRKDNMEILISEIDVLSAQFFEIAQSDSLTASDYMSSEEFLNSTIEYKEAYSRLYSFMSGIFDSMQRFINEINIEKILPDILEVQNRLRQGYIRSDELEIRIDKINEYLNLQPKYEQSLQKQRKELEEIPSLIEKDEELLMMQKAIEESIAKSEESLF